MVFACAKRDLIAERGRDMIVTLARIDDVDARIRLARCAAEDGVIACP